MKIIYLHQYFKFPHQNGGTRSYDLATSFIKEGLNVEVLTTTDISNSKNRWTSIQKDGLIVHMLYLPYSNELSYLKRIFIFIKFVWHSSFKLLSIKADLVIATSTPLTIGIPALLKRWFQKTPFIFEVRDVWPEVVIAIGALNNIFINKLLFQLEYIIYKYASAIVPLSCDMKHSIISRNPSLNNKIIQTIENISETHRFQNGYSDDKSIIADTIGFNPRFTILYAGTFGKVNGLHYTIELATKTLKIDSSIVFILVGEGSEKPHIKKIARSNKVINKNVFFLKSVAKKDLSQLYFESNMGSSFVIPVNELWANSANKFFDSLAAGKPILINHEGWQKTVIENDNLGYVLPSELDNQAIIDFVEYTKNDNLQQQQQINTLKKAIDSYSLEIAVKKYISIINNVV